MIPNPTPKTSIGVKTLLNSVMQGNPDMHCQKGLSGQTLLIAETGQQSVVMVEFQVFCRTTTLLGGILGHGSDGESGG